MRKFTKKSMTFQTGLVRTTLSAACIGLFSLETFASDVDLIVEGDYVITMQDDDSIIEQGAIAIKDGVIVEVGKANNIRKKYQTSNIIPGHEKVLMPGLINGHSHSAMTLFRGIADDLDLMDWLTQYIFPIENKFVTPEFIKTGAELACYEMIQSGTTTFVDMYFYPEVIADVMVDCGLRAIITAPMIDTPSPGFKGWNDSFSAGEKYVRQWQNKHPRITPGFGPHAPYTVIPEHLKQVGEVAKKLSAPISIHVAETSGETDIIQSQYHKTPVTHVLSQLQDNWIIAAHMVHPLESEYPSMTAANLGAIHNPTSNAKLASGLSPVPEMLNAGIRVGLGTDGAASNNNLDMFEEIRTAALIHKLESGDPKKLPAVDALKLATKYGAAAIGFESSIGQLKTGYSADLIQLDLSEARIHPIYDIISHLVYVIDSDQVVTTIVDGKVLMLNKDVKTLDGRKIKEEAQHKAKEIQQYLRKH